ncbi:MAG: hypothetical protein KGZ83_21940 [Sulfuricella sp.]|nr:hypothetical protein [Sulfuricella sp.]
MKTAKNAPQWTREKVKRYLVQRFYTRFHMSLILSSSALAAMLVNWGLLHGGVGAMWLRYPVAIGVSYLTFLTGVWLWLRYVGLVRDDSGAGSALVDNLDVPDISLGKGGTKLELPEVLPRSGGGQFGGGGANAGWIEDSPAIPLRANSSGASSSGIGGALGDFGDLDGDAIVLLLLALLLIASVFLLSGYVIWFAPDILGEAAFGALLAGSLSKTAKRHDQDDWVAGVVKKTWWPFAIILALALAFAIFATQHYPGAKTFGQAVAMASGG